MLDLVPFPRAVNMQHAHLDVKLLTAVWGDNACAASALQCGNYTRQAHHNMTTVKLKM